MARVIEKERTLAYRFPEIAKEWHPEKNGDLTPEDVTFGIGQKVWWVCSKNKDHEWEAKVCKRTTGTDCPYCTGQRVCSDNCLATLNPELSREWHCERNHDLTPRDITEFSNKKVWWVCSKNKDHEWEAIVNNRTKKNAGCPYCTGQRVCSDNCLATLNPELSREWHYEKNGKLRPEDVTFGSGQRVWWVCSKNKEHEWKATVKSRTNGTGCPKCSQSKTTSFPNMVIYFYFREVFKDSRMEFTIPNSRHRLDIYVPSLNIGIEYDGQYYHQKKERDIRKDKKLAKEMPNTKLIRIREPKCPPYVSPNENVQLSHLTDLKTSTLEETISSIFQSIKSKIDIDINRDRQKIRDLIEYVDVKDSLENKFPDISKEWHPGKNGNLKPSSVKSRSHKKVWWVCSKNKEHEWEAIVSNRSCPQGATGCPQCRAEKLSKHSTTLTLQNDLNIPEQMAS